MPNSQGIYCFIFDTFSLIFSNPIFILIFLESSPKFSNQQNHAKTFFFLFFLISTKKKIFVSGLNIAY